MKTKARFDIFFFMTSLLCSKTRRVLRYFCYNRRYISLFLGFPHVLVIRVVMEGRAPKASGLVNFPASAFHKWPCFRLLTTTVILVRGLKLWIRTKRNHWNQDLFAGITKFGSYGDSIAKYRRKPLWFSNMTFFPLFARCITLRNNFLNAFPCKIP